MTSRILSTLLLGFASASAAISVGDPSDRLAFDSLAHAHFEFTGPVGQGIHANLDHWLLRAPQANPGLVEIRNSRWIKATRKCRLPP